MAPLSDNRVFRLNGFWKQIFWTVYLLFGLSQGKDTTEILVFKSCLQQTCLNMVFQIFHVSKFTTFNNIHTFFILFFFTNTFLSHYNKSKWNHPDNFSFIFDRIKTEATSRQGFPKKINKQASINFAFDIFDMHKLHSIFLDFCIRIQGTLLL